MRRLGRVRPAAAAAGVFLVAAALSGASVARAASDQRASTPAVARAAAVVTGYQVRGELYGVAATSRGNAWAVGDVRDPSVSATGTTTLLLHWNGGKWSPVTSPKPVPGRLTQVAAASATDAWAVGEIDTPHGHTTSYVLHWNGKAWSVQHSPAPVGYASYSGVAASGSNAWIVGLVTGLPGVVPPGGLAVRGTGGQWQPTTVPGAAQTTLSGVAFGGGGTAWAAGCVCYGSSARSGVILHWTGTQWKVAGRLGDALPETVAAGPGGQAWLVGNDPAGANGDEGFSAHWNGKTWRPVAVPRQVGSPLHGVAYFPGGTVWAVGSRAGQDVPFILRWTGKAWTQVAAPAGRRLRGVAGDAANDGWAVGGDGTTTTILHWNGKSWS
jgi:hypothetical protein